MRVCQCGCGQKLLRPDGTTDWKRKFFDRECLGRDKRRRMQEHRRAAKSSRCGTCGARSPSPMDPPPGRPPTVWVELNGRKLGLTTIGTALRLVNEFHARLLQPPEVAVIRTERGKPPVLVPKVISMESARPRAPRGESSDGRKRKNSAR